MAILMSDKADFRARKTVRCNEGLDIMIKWSILPRDITILSVCVSKNRAFQIHEAKTDGTARRNR